MRGRLSLNLGLTVPTGNTPRGEYAFEPIVGNAGQWGLGAGVDGNLSFSVGNSSKLNLSLVANYRYLFEDKQRRTVGINGNSMGLESELPAINNFNQYYLLGKVGDAVGTPLTPAANVLAINVHARSGAQLDTIFNINYTNKGFTLDLGYNLFWKEAESLTLTNDSWTDDQYAIAKNNLNVTTLESGTIAAHGYFNVAQDAQGAKAISASDLDLQRAASQSQVTHKAYLGLGYIFKRYQRPWMLGIASSYEFADRNALANWALWCKAGVAF